MKYEVHNAPEATEHLHEHGLANMEKLSLREAVKHFDVSRPTLQKALKSGKISGVQDGQGHWTIAPSELVRVYKARVTEDATFTTHNMVKLTTDNAMEQTLDELVELRQRLVEAERRAAISEALAEERAKHIEDLRRMLPKPVIAETKRIKWWPWRNT